MEHVALFGGAGLAAGVARLAGKTGFEAVAEQLLLLKKDSSFREVVTILSSFCSC